MPQVKGQALRKRNCTHTSAVSLVPRPFGGGGEKRPGDEANQQYNTVDFTSLETA